MPPPDVVTEQDARNFKEYEYTADALPEFTGFVVKIVGQSSNTSIVPSISIEMYRTCIMKSKYAKVEGHSELIRDEMSHAIINMDDEAYRLTIRRREMMKSQRNEINTLKQEVTEIKFLLKEMIEKLHG